MPRPAAPAQPLSAAAPAPPAPPAPAALPLQGAPAAAAGAMDTLNRRIVACTRCPRLRAHCVQTAEVKRASFRHETYFARPVPNFGDAAARLLIVGLAPAAHGANRTGRMFTGDRSGDFLYRALYDAGFASRPTAEHADDGLRLRDALITATCHCAPPANKPAPEEIANCAPYFEETLALLPRVKVVLCLGQIAFQTVLRHARGRGWIARMSAYRFAHGAEHAVSRSAADAAAAAARLTLLCSYHPSQQNTFTGKLTPAMMRAVLERARELLGE